jgi:NRAMP (natural resistance-associated macrophage protein)-like metal ion transporter
MGVLKYGKKAGPGIVTGAADNDPSGIATYSQTGAQFGYDQLWTALFLLPLQTAIQESCARVGAITGQGLAALIKKQYGSFILFFLVFLVLVANIINIGADLAAMTATVRLLIPVPFSFLIILFTASIVILEIFVCYKDYAGILKWLCLTLLAYPLTLFFIHAPWLTILKSTFIPTFKFDFQFLFIITGVLGTTISPYLFFWEASHEVEEVKCKHLAKNGAKPKISKKFMRNLRIDNFLGMLFSQICAWSIIVVAATVLNPHGITDIKTAADAAKALEPFVGRFAEIIFAVGVVGLGFLSISILAGSGAYALSEAFNWTTGLDLKFSSARGFYSVIIFSTVIGLLIGSSPINPMKALVYAAVINGVVAVPLIFFIWLIANNKKIMGNHKSGWLSNIFVWLCFICMGVTSIAMFVTMGKG